MISDRAMRPGDVLTASNGKVRDSLSDYYYYDDDY